MDGRGAKLDFESPLFNAANLAALTPLKLHAQLESAVTGGGGFSARGTAQGRRSASARTADDVLPQIGKAEANQLADQLDGAL